MFLFKINGDRRELLVTNRSDMLGGGATWGDGYDRRGQSKCFATLDSSGHITKWTHNATQHNTTKHNTTQHNTTLVRKSQ